jgi:hypothetical protein
VINLLGVAEDSFRKSRNTMPRIINIILGYPNALLRSQLLADRLQLDSGETRSRHPAFTDCAEKFNNKRYVIDQLSYLLGNNNCFHLLVSIRVAL